MTKHVKTFTPEDICDREWKETTKKRPTERVIKKKNNFDDFDDSLTFFVKDKKEKQLKNILKSKNINRLMDVFDDEN